jgi:hypothetical protein
VDQKINEGTEFRNARPMSDCKKIHQSLITALALIESCGLPRGSKSWKDAAKVIKKIINEDLKENPVDMTRAYERMPKRYQINLTDPSLAANKKNE